MTNKLASIIIVIVMSLGICCGCGKKLPFNAVKIADGNTYVFDNIVSKNSEYFTDDFWKENVICGVGYINEKWDPDDPNSEKHVYYPDLPNKRLLIITNQEEYDHTFVKQWDIDFEKEILLVYMTRGQRTHGFVIKDIKLGGQVLTVVYSRERIKKAKPDASAPTRVWCVLKMDKLDVATVEFKNE